MTAKDGAIYACASSGGVFRSRNDGERWDWITSSLGGLGAIRARVLAQDILGGLFLATDGQGVFASPDAGATWNEMNAGLSDRRVYAITASQEGSLIAGTYGSGMFRNAHVASADPVAGTPRTPLFRNAPNPFRTATEFEWMQERAGSVSITMHDLFGRLVAVVADDDVGPGLHRAAFRRGSGQPPLAAGVYMASLRTPHGSAIRLVQVLP
jgi:hypothetical protein